MLRMIVGERRLCQEVGIVYYGDCESVFCDEVTMKYDELHLQFLGTINKDSVEICRV